MKGAEAEMNRKEVKGNARKGRHAKEAKFPEANGNSRKRKYKNGKGKVPGGRLCRVSV